MGPPLTRGAGGASSGVGAAGGARDPLKSPRRGAAGTIRGEVPPAAPSIPAGLQPRAQIAPKSPIRAGGSQTKGTGEPGSLGADGRRWPLSAPREFRLGKAACGSGGEVQRCPRTCGALRGRGAERVCTPAPGRARPQGGKSARNPSTGIHWPRGRQPGEMPPHHRRGRAFSPCYHPYRFFFFFIFFLSFLAAEIWDLHRSYLPKKSQL